MSKFRVLISDSMSSRAKEILSASSAIEVDERPELTPGDLIGCIGDYDGLLVRSRSKVTAEVIEKAARLKVVGRAGIGVDNIDLAAASRRGIIVENAPSGNTVTTAEHALCLLLSLVRNIPQATASMKAGKWEKKKLSGSELFGKTFGVIGLGNIGRIVADRGRGLKMKVIGFDPFLSSDAAARLGVELVSLDDLLARADFISIHTPLTSETRGLIGTDEFGKMKRGAFLVNAARGGIVDEAACVKALDDGILAGAAFDVFVEEPTPAEHPLVNHPKVICTPHLGASTDEAQEKVAVEVAEQMVAFAERGEVKNAVNMAPVSAEMKQTLGPWMDLSARLGSMVGQLVAHGEGSLDSVKVEVTGEAAEEGATACTDQVLVGLLRDFAEASVNEVNARLLAEERGLEVSESKIRQGRDLSSTISVTVTRKGATKTVKGTLYHIGGNAVARVVQIDDFLVELAPEGRILVVENQDRPGVIGKVGSLLGDRGINVDGLHVAHDRDAETALALWSVDAELDDELMAAVRKLPLISSAVVVAL